MLYSKFKEPTIRIQVHYGVLDGKFYRLEADQSVYEDEDGPTYAYPVLEADEAKPYRAGLLSVPIDSWAYPAHPCELYYKAFEYWDTNTEKLERLEEPILYPVDGTIAIESGRLRDNGFRIVRRGRVLHEYGPSGISQIDATIAERKFKLLQLLEEQGITDAEELEPLFAVHRALEEEGIQDATEIKAALTRLQDEGRTQRQLERVQNLLALIGDEDRELLEAWFEFVDKTPVQILESYRGLTDEELREKLGLDE